MKKINKWVKNQLAAVVMATSNVEKNALGQETVDLGADTGKYQRVNQGTLADSLINGEITEEVKKKKRLLNKN